MEGEYYDYKLLRYLEGHVIVSTAITDDDIDGDIDGGIDGDIDDFSSWKLWINFIVESDWEEDDEGDLVEISNHFVKDILIRLININFPFGDFLISNFKSR